MRRQSPLVSNLLSAPVPVRSGVLSTMQPLSAPPLSFPLSPGLMRSEAARLDKMGQFSLHWSPSVVSSGKHHYGGSEGHYHAIWERHFWGCGLQLALRFTVNGNVLPKSISIYPGLQDPGQAPKLTIQA